MNKATYSKVKKALSNVTATGLVYNRTTRDFDEIQVAPTIFERDGMLIISAEDGGLFADYYGEYRGGDQWINPSLEKAVRDAGCHLEWENPGCLYISQ